VQVAWREATRQHIPVGLRETMNAGLSLKVKFERIKAPAPRHGKPAWKTAMENRAQKIRRKSPSGGLLLSAGSAAL
jgi:hypothetical protein